MKKEKFYSFIYGTILLGVLTATTVNGQLAYNATAPTIDYKPYETVEEVKSEVNTEAISTLSTAIREGLEGLKAEGVELESGKWYADVAISADGVITNVKVSGSQRNDFHKVLNGIIQNVKNVVPITYNGVAKGKIVRIPVVLA